MKIFFSLLFFIFQFSFSFAQQSKNHGKTSTGKIPGFSKKADSIAAILHKNERTESDSLLDLLKSAKEDTGKVNLLNKIFTVTYSGAHNDTSLFYYARRMLRLSEKIHFVKGQGIADYLLGASYIHIEKKDSALFYFRKAVDLSSKSNDKPTAISAYSKMGTMYMDTTDFPHAIQMTLNALKLAEEINQKKGIANAYNSLGNIYSYQKNYNQAIIYHKKSLALRLELKDKRTMSHSYFNLGSNYYEVEKYDSAIYFLDKAFEIQTEMGNTIGQAYSYDVYGKIYCKEKKYDKALEYFQKAKIILNDRKGEETEVIESLLGIGDAYNGKRDFDKAERIFIEAMNESQQLKFKDMLSASYAGLSTALEGQKKFQEALRYHQLYKQLSDSTYNAQNAQQVATLQQQYESDKKENSMKLSEEKKEAEHEAEVKKQKIIVWSVGAGLLLVILFAGFIFRSLRETQKQKRIVEAQKHETEKQKEIIAEKNKDISDSINYAKRIQEAIFPSKEIKYKLFPDAFVLFQPKDVVSGDFYWFTEKNGRRLIAAADCTGHGVPGAFMSMIGTTFLNEIVNERGVVSPEEILSELRFKIIKALNQTGAEGEQKDGMDIALLSFDDVNSTVEYSGAYNSLWFFRNGEFKEYEPNKRPIGYHQGKGLPFMKHIVKIQKGDSLYIFTDGFADQFGGPKGKKFRYKQMQELFSQISDKPMTEQEKIIYQTFFEWKGSLEQIDDVLVIGIKI